MRVLLVSTYELGHQPLHLASPAAALLGAGHEVDCIDLSVQQWEPELVDRADAVAFSVPMHTAMRLAVRAATAVRRRRPGLPICLYGLYAPVGKDAIVGRVADRAIAGEYEPALVEWVGGLAGDLAGDARVATTIELGRTRFALPARHLLPPLDRYARLALADERRITGYVEASHGCAHRCRHCPVPVVYDARIRIVEEQMVLDDVAQLVEMGARHITFGDPDFLNGPKHSLRVVRAMNERFPDLTFDCTAKIEHILRHADIWPDMASSGCLFVVTALESVNNSTLEMLDKGHTAEDGARAISVLRNAGIEPRPSLLPFTPRTELGHVLELLDFVLDHDLVPNIDPVQYSIRLLIPDGSLILDRLDGDEVGPYDPQLLSFSWTSPDPRVDALQDRIASLAESAAGEDLSTSEAYRRVRLATLAALGIDPSADSRAHEVASLVDHLSERPRLSEPWFCCAEPTGSQLESLAGLPG